MSLELAADVRESIVVLGEDENAVAVPATTSRPARCGDVEHLLVDVGESAFLIFSSARCRAHSAISSISVEQLHFLGEIGVIGLPRVARVAFSVWRSA